MRNFLSMLLISQGVPFLTQGDEFGRTQQGNNNAYCQESDISWLNWDLAETNAGLVRFTRMMIALRKRHFAIDREQLQQPDHLAWSQGRGGLEQSQPLAGVPPARRARQPDLYVIFNAHWEAQRFQLPASPRQLAAAGGHQPPFAARHRRGPRRRTPQSQRSLHRHAALDRDPDFATTVNGQPISNSRICRLGRLALDRLNAH